MCYRASDVGKMMVKGQEGLSRGCVVQLGCFCREGMLLCVVVEVPVPAPKL